MQLFIFFFVKALHGQLIQLINQSFTTSDGRGTVFNYASCDILSLQPSVPYQNIKQDNVTKQIIINGSAGSAGSVLTPNCILTPTILFQRRPQIAGLFGNLNLNVSIRHQFSTQLLPTFIGSFNFSIILSFEEYNGNRVKEFSIVMTSSGQSRQSNITRNISGLVFLDCNQTFIQQNATNKSKFFRFIALKQFVSLLINSGRIANNDTFTGISLRGAFSRGGFDSANYRTFINHSLTYSVSYYYKEENLGIFYSFFPFYFQPTIQESGDFQYLAATQNSNMKMYFVINPNNTGKYRPCSGDRIGYYNNSKYVNNKANLNLDYFPLDPAQDLNYFIRSNDSKTTQTETARCFGIYLRRDYSLITNSFTNLSDQTLISQIVYVCLQNYTVLQEGVYIQQVNYYDSFSTPSNITFGLYEKANQTGNEPYVFTFLSNVSSEIVRINLFFFVNRLFNAGKFHSSERISQISKCVRFFSGTGMHQFYNMIFPSKTSLVKQKISLCNDSTQGCPSNSFTSIICDTIGNWVQVNGTCRCNSGYTQITKDNMTSCVINSPPIILKKSLACMLADQNQTQNSCLGAIPPKAQAALALSSAPNLGMMLKVSQVLCLVDDFMFYVYTNMTYGREFEKFLYFMWNISMERWVPSSFSSFYYDIQDKYDESVEMKNIRLLPKLWTELQEDTGFISNTRDYWIGSIPFTAITFILMHLLFTVLRKHKISFSDNIVFFKWFTVLFVNLFLQNVQILAFRAFQQIFYGQSPNAQNFSQLYFLNQIICYVTFFFVLVSACAGQYIIRIFIAQNIKHVMDIVWYSNLTVWFMIIIQLTKVTNGFLHACYQMAHMAKFSILLITQSIIFITILYFRSYFRLKLMFVLMATQFFLKIIIHVILVMRVLFKLLSYELSLVEQNELGNIEITLIWIIFGVAAFELLTMAIKVPKIPAHCRTDINKITSVSRRKRIVKQKSKAQVQIHKSVSNSKHHIQPSISIQQNGKCGIIDNQKSITFKFNKKVLTHNSTQRKYLFQKFTYLPTITTTTNGTDEVQTIQIKAQNSIKKITRK